MSSSDAIKRTDSRGVSDTTAETHRSHGWLQWWYYRGSVLLDKMVTILNDAHLRQKLYKEGEDLTMEKALHTIRIYVAKHKAQVTSVKPRFSPTTTTSRGLKGVRPRTKTARTSVGNSERNPSARTEMLSSWSGVLILHEKGTLLGGM